MHKKDFTITELARKKKELIKNLFTKSQRLIIPLPEKNISKLFEDRKQIIEALNKTDQALSIREKETGIKADLQEKELFDEVSFLLESIIANDDILINRLNKEKHEVLTQRNELRSRNKLSRYIKRKSPETKIMTSNAKKSYNSPQTLTISI